MRLKKYLALVLCMVVLGVVGCSSEKKATPKLEPAQSYTGWTTVNLGKVGTMQIPPTMEVRTTEMLKKDMEAAKNDPKKLMELQKEGNLVKGAGNVVCQAKADKDTKGKYAKVSFVGINVQEKVPAFGRPLGLTAEQIKDFGEITKNGILEQKNQSQVKVLKWEPMKSEIINGAEFLHIAYEEQKGTEAPAYVDRYTFFDKNVIYTLEVASRTSEKDFWHAKDKDISNIINTINIKA